MLQPLLDLHRRSHSVQSSPPRTALDPHKHSRARSYQEPVIATTQAELTTQALQTSVPPTTNSDALPEIRSEWPAHRYVDLKGNWIKYQDIWTNDPSYLCLDKYFPFSPRNIGYQWGDSYLRPILRKKKGWKFLLMDNKDRYYLWDARESYQIARIECDVEDTDDAVMLVLDDIVEFYGLTWFQNKAFWDTQTQWRAEARKRGEYVPEMLEGRTTI